MSNINNLEIERKYLVASDEFKSLATKCVRIRQGYLSTNEKSTIRVRLWDDQAFITIKSRGKEGSCAHFEWEKEISQADAEQLLALCTSGLIDKTRYIVPLPYSASGLIAEGGLTAQRSYSPPGGLICEVDVFHGDNEGLILAEVELQEETQTFTKPAFLADEVTSDHRYYNSYLSLHPFTTW